jgi:RNA polymerase sigma-70 factor (ECF subfamily)
VSEEEIYNDLAPRLMRYATVLVGPSDAEDVVSTVVARAVSRPGGLSALEDAAAYLMKSVLNESKGFRRARARRRTSPVALVPDGAGRGPDSTVEVRQLIDELPARQRAAAYLVFFEENTAVEAARLLGTQPATVRRYVHIARQKIERALS